MTIIKSNRDGWLNLNTRIQFSATGIPKPAAAAAALHNDKIADNSSEA